MNSLQQHIARALEREFGIKDADTELSPTKKNFQGDLTWKSFAMAKQAGITPPQMARKVGEYLLEHAPQVAGFNVAGGFLNLILADSYFTGFVRRHHKEENFGLLHPDPQARKLMVEYSSPNTNKPLHLGHIRNNLLGYSIAEIYKATGKPVIKTQIINDRGIHICKSMLAWQKFGRGETPESSGMKGDHLVGKYYVEFDKHYKEQVKALMAQGVPEDEAKNRAPLMVEARDMLRRWEQKDPEVMRLWEMMNRWVLDGFKETYEALGVDFDVEYFESDTYLLGKKIVEEGLKKGVFYRKPDGSVWVDLTDEGLDEKLLLRADGTSVYITQDLGTAVKRFSEFDIDTLIYVVGNEQDYHFKVLFAILKKLGYDWADRLYHLSYGMVELPDGKMKSREGTVVDADDLMAQMTETARQISEELGKTEGLPPNEKEELYRIIGLAALKYHLLKVDPRKTILFDPKKSIDFNGNTGPFLQYTYVRIRSILRKAGIDEPGFGDLKPNEKERLLVRQLERFPQIIAGAAAERNPANIANYLYETARTFNSFYQAHSILQAGTEEQKHFRLALAELTAHVIRNGLKLLGIQVPERM